MADSIEDKEELKVELERLVRETERFCREEAESVRLRAEEVRDLCLKHRYEIPKDVFHSMAVLDIYLRCAEVDLKKAEDEAKKVKVWPDGRRLSRLERGRDTERGTEVPRTVVGKGKIKN